MRPITKFGGKNEGYRKKARKKDEEKKKKIFRENDNSISNL